MTVEVTVECASVQAGDGSDGRIRDCIIYFFIANKCNLLLYICALLLNLTVTTVTPLTISMFYRNPYRNLTVTYRHKFLKSMFWSFYSNCKKDCSVLRSFKRYRNGLTSNIQDSKGAKISIQHHFDIVKHKNGAIEMSKY